ncbi:hypothetical protein ACFQJD_10795 [Haloplanus sp. GCM10025708]|uniref:hypothetical protein n=1 Tax=Haloplanus sp. GCM10025708 TaxID=3252679 RepID=UPI0036203EB9
MTSPLSAAAVVGCLFVATFAGGVTVATFTDTASVPVTVEISDDLPTPEPPYP